MSEQTAAGGAESIAIDAGPLGAFQKEVEETQREMADRFDAQVRLEIDYAGLFTGKNAEANGRLLDALRSDVFRNWLWMLGEVNEQVRLEGRLSSIRLEGLPARNQRGGRAVFSEGSRIVYRLSLTGDEGIYSMQDMPAIVAGVVAG